MKSAEKLRLTKRIEKLTETLQDAIFELKCYSQGRRDTSFHGWEKTWKEIEIVHESDYEYYPNHVDKKTIDEFLKVLEEK
jgi:hypothetical protein